MSSGQALGQYDYLIIEWSSFHWLAAYLTYGRALMGRASRENISCRGLRWDIFPLRSDYGSTSMAWVGLLKWAIYMWHSLLQV